MQYVLIRTLAKTEDICLQVLTLPLLYVGIHFIILLRINLVFVFTHVKNHVIYCLGHLVSYVNISSHQYCAFFYKKNLAVVK